MSHLQTFQVFPSIPESLTFLEKLSRNTWWCWHLDAIELFRRINPSLWKKSGRNPIVFSTLVPQKRLEELANDNSFLAHVKRVKDLFESQIHSKIDRSDSPYGENGKIAYFSMEFGIHESIPLFAGGLGVLAGDHLKAASDMALPLVGVGLLYQQGYFHQFLDQTGWQQEEYPETDLYHLPVKRAKDRSGKDIYINVDGGPGVKIRAVVWVIDVGRIPLYLLDTNLPENPPEVRKITSRLYAADSKIRLTQEVLLGIGGVRALEALDIYPQISHMNEGHCAFSSLERLSQIITTYNVDLSTAMEIIARTTVFTTHTPVAAGHDEFPIPMVKPFLVSFQERLRTTIDDIISWGQPAGAEPDHPFSMSILAIRMAQYCNGVSELHGNVARQMWKSVWPGRPVDELPISHVTNGVHVPSWISVENSLLFERYIGPQWYLRLRKIESVKRIDEIYDEELWRAHEMSRSRLIRACRMKMVKQHGRRNASKAMMKEAECVLDQDTLTIAFARRFATYKRANLLLHDPERFAAILNSKEYPVQFIFSGKAHPNDDEGKAFIQRLIQFADNPSLRHKIVFVEDYDINVARHLVQGADVWLNTPLRPHEACGTSGIKAAVNGVLNLSILDGWWCEGYSEDTGWRIGNGEEYEDYGFQNAVESQALYNTLENDVIPCFYERKNGAMPVRWLEMMKESMKMAIGSFGSHRMVGDYENKFYLPIAKRFPSLITADAKEARALDKQHKRLKSLWKDIRIEPPVRKADGPFRVGESFQITVTVNLGQLSPEEVHVEVYYGSIKSIDSFAASYTESMSMEKALGNGKYFYACSIECVFSGRYGFTARVTPSGDSLIKSSPGLITWVS